MSFSRGLKAKAEKVWEEGYNHPFVQGIGKGTLDKEKFKFYLLQDYLYLLEYSKVYAAAALKSPTEELQLRFTTVQHFILTDEMEVHRRFMSDFGITNEEIANVKPSLYNKTYTANMLAYGLTGNLAEIMATVFPCAWTYADYGQRLKVQYTEALEGNFYRAWIEKYAGMDFSGSFGWFYDTIDELVANMSAKEQQNIADIFVSSVEFEYLFWDMAYNQQMSWATGL